jgi:hypothetical protein
MALGSTQPLTEMSTRNLRGDKERPSHKAENLTAICELTVQKMWEPRRLTTLWAFTACYRTKLYLLLPYIFPFSLDETIKQEGGNAPILLGCAYIF